MALAAKVLVIGAGPYGVAIAQELWERDIDFVIVGEPFALWHRHTLDTMALRSDCLSSEIYSRRALYSYARFLERQGATSIVERARVSTFRRYLVETVERLPFEIVEDRVTRLERYQDGFSAACARGTSITAAAVIIATGLGGHRYLPKVLRQLPAELVIHSWHARKIEALRRQRVLVIGAGQAAAEAVASLRSSHRVTWALRHRPLFFSEPLRVPTPLFKAFLLFSRGLYKLPPSAVRAVSRPVFRTTITPGLRQVFTDTGVRKVFEDAEGLGLRATADGLYSAAVGETFDCVVAATGYRFTLRGLPFLSAGLVRKLGGSDRAPRLGADFQTGVRNLFMAGGISEPTFGPSMRFIFGSRHAARRLGSAMAGI